MSAMVKIADRNYLEKRAIEFISEAEACRISNKTRMIRLAEALGSGDLDEEEYVKYLKRAVQCLALAIIKEE